MGFGSAEAISLSPQLIEDLIDVYVVDICIGDSHCLALTQDSTLYSWGINTMGQCGQGKFEIFPALKVVVSISSGKVGIMLLPNQSKEENVQSGQEQSH